MSLKQYLHKFTIITVPFLFFIFSLTLGTVLIYLLLDKILDKSFGLFYVLNPERSVKAIGFYFFFLFFCSQT